MTTNYLDNFYSRLGISKDASPTEIKAAYHQAAKRLHPDTNKSPAANELFLQVQEAFSTLSNKDKRSEYDKILPEDIGAPPDILVNQIYSRKILPIGDSPQIVYLLLDLMATKENRSQTDNNKPPLNISIVMDTSTSMKGERLNALKITASKIVSDLTERDYLSLITFNDHAEVIIPGNRGQNFSKVDSRIKMINTKGGTEIFKGLQAGILEISKNLKPNHINHLILITDGRTYGDENECLQIAEEALKTGVSISCLGIGQDWNDNFLDEIAFKTGGSSFYASDSDKIQTILNKKIDQLNLTYANNVKLEFNTPKNVDLRNAFRMSPDSNELEMRNPLELGSIPIGGHLAVMFEFYISDVQEDIEELLLTDGKLHLTIPNRVIPKTENKIFFSRPVGHDPINTPPPNIIVKALSHLSLYRLQEQAQKKISSGNLKEATKLLKNLEVKLLNSGVPDLAHTVHLEVEKIKKGNSLSKKAHKQIKYGTRALVFPQEDK